MEELREKLRGAIKGLFGVEIEVEVVKAPSTVAEGTGADYASNVAMKLAGVLHRSPMEIAEELKAYLEPAFSSASSSSEDAMLARRMSNTARSASPSSLNKLEDNRGVPSVFKVEVAAPGFLNFISPDEYYDEKVAEIAQNLGNLAKNIAQDEYAGKTIVAEFSDPNPFKVLHVGHLYTSVVGDSISRLLESAGARVVRANFGGDVGLHVAKTLYSVLATCNEDSLSSRISSSDSAAAPSQDAKSSSVRCSSLPRTSSKLTSSCEQFDCGLTIEEIAKCYVEGTRAYEEDEDAKAEIGKLNRVIYAIAEVGEEGCRERLRLEQIAENFEISTAEVARIAELYWRGRELSYEYFEDFYAKIGVKFDKYYPESSVAGRGLAEVKAHVGTVYEESEGAVVFRGEKVGLHTRVFINAQGVPTYEAKDVGLIFTKWDDFQFDESIVVTGNEQAEYMKVVLASVSEYAPELVERTRHLTHGLVKLAGNVKMSSRKGNFLKAVDVIEMVRENLSSGEVLSSSGSVDLSKSNPASQGRDFDPVQPGDNLQTTKPSPDDRTSGIITLAALKYSFLKYKMGGDIVFDPKESVAVNGNSGVYLLYSVVRARKILHKIQDNSASLVQSDGAVASNDLSDSRQYIRKLSKKIVEFEEILRIAIKERAPHKLCTYLYELAQEWSRFYEQVRVVGGGNEAELEKYVQAYVGVMEYGLELLGIMEIPEEM